MPLLHWKDNAQWMHPMRGSRWTSRLRAENTAFHTALSDAATKDDIELATKAFKDAYRTWETSGEWVVEKGAHKIYVYPQAGQELRWAWGNECHPVAGDLDITENGIVVYSTDTGMGEYSIIAEAKHRNTKLWTHNGSQSGLSAELAILGKRVFMIEASSNLQYDSLVSVDILSGKDKRIHYKEKNPSYSLSLIKGENGCLFLLSENAGTQNLYYMAGGNLKRLSEECSSFFPVGFAPNSKEPCYFTRENNTWVPHGATLKNYKIPKADAIDEMILRNGLFIHRRHGERYIDVCGKKVRRLGKILGEVVVHPWNIWHGTGALSLHIIVPGCSPIRGVLRDTLYLEDPIDVYANKILTDMVPSADGTLVRWSLVYNDRCRPKAVIITAYGAYNTPTSLDTTRWKPFLDSGFAIGFAFVRGGGDHDEAWADAARVHKKYTSVEDLEACIRMIRGVLHLDARHTCIFGSSAGGYLVGSAATRHPEGELFGSIYTESPYVDVLSTANNPQLPLTKYEYMEFGDPRHVIADFETLLRLGPITGLDEKGAPGLFVICRVGLNDRQVYAYESVKWMDALRGKQNTGKEKLLEIITEDGHFSRGIKMYAERASDFLLLSKRILG
jgi:hypothetical protein